MLKLFQRHVDLLASRVAGMKRTRPVPVAFPRAYRLWYGLSSALLVLGGFVGILFLPKVVTMPLLHAAFPSAIAVFPNDAQFVLMLAFGVCFIGLLTLGALLVPVWGKGNRFAEYILALKVLVWLRTLGTLPRRSSDVHADIEQIARTYDVFAIPAAWSRNRIIGTLVLTVIAGGLFVGTRTMPIRVYAEEIRTGTHTVAWEDVVSLTLDTEERHGGRGQRYMAPTAELRLKDRSTIELWSDVYVDHAADVRTLCKEIRTRGLALRVAIMLTGIDRMNATAQKALTAVLTSEECH